MTHTCETCTATFERPPSQRGRFCSRACGYAAMRGAGNPMHDPGARVTRTCMTCSATFETWRSEPGRYCSRACLGCANGKRVAVERRKRVDYVCEVCGTLAQARPCELPRKRFCSRKCSHEAMRTASDYRYGEDWLSQRRAARARDGYECQECGALKHLHVHHKVPYRISRSNALANLVTLCASCHTTEEARLRAIERNQTNRLLIG